MSPVGRWLRTLAWTLTVGCSVDCGQVAETGESQPERHDLGDASVEDAEVGPGISAEDAAPDGAATIDAAPQVPDAPLDASSVDREEIPDAPHRDAVALTEAPRILFFYTPHGTILDAWRPIATESGFQLGSILAPLERFHDQLLVIDGLDNLERPGVPASTHSSGPTVLLTAQVEPPYDASTDIFLGTGGPSLDMVVGSSETVFRNAILGIGTHSAAPRLVNFTDDGQPMIPMVSPAEAMLRLWGPPVSPEIQALDPLSDQQLPRIATLQLKNAVDALAHDITRAVTVDFWDESGTGRLPWLGFIDTYEQLAAGSTQENGRAKFIAVQTWVATQFAQLLDLLSAIPVGGGTLLDQMAVVWISETGEASSHSGKGIPVVIAGRLGGSLRSGQYLHYDGRSQADLMLTLARAMGRSTFGDPVFAPRVLGEMVK
jgi:Protein of unknown function (DUF1552)